MLLDPCLEFVIADFALIESHIISITIDRLSLLSDVVDQVNPSAIICQAHFISQLLEVVIDLKEGSDLIIIVVGEFDQALVKQVGGAVRLVSWEDVERNGGSVAYEPTPSSKSILQVALAFI